LNILPAAFLARHRLKLLFVCVWLHISLLDLFYVTYRGPVFLWQENTELLTIVVHIAIALITVAFYWLITTLFSKITARFSQS